MPETEVEKLIETAQISESQVQNSHKNPDFENEEATIVAKWNG